MAVREFSKDSNAILAHIGGIKILHSSGDWLAPDSYGIMLEKVDASKCSRDLLHFIDVIFAVDSQAVLKQLLRAHSGQDIKLICQRVIHCEFK